MAATGKHSLELDSSKSTFDSIRAKLARRSFNDGHLRDGQYSGKSIWATPHAFVQFLASMRIRWRLSWLYFDQQLQTEDDFKSDLKEVFAIQHHGVSVFRELFITPVAESLTDVLATDILKCFLLIVSDIYATSFKEINSKTDKFDDAKQKRCADISRTMSAVDHHIAVLGDNVTLQSWARHYLIMSIQDGTKKRSRSQEDDLTGEETSKRARITTSRTDRLTANDKEQGIASNTTQPLVLPDAPTTPLKPRWTEMDLRDQEWAYFYQSGSYVVQEPDLKNMLYKKGQAWASPDYYDIFLAGFCLRVQAVIPLTDCALEDVAMLIDDTLTFMALDSGKRNVFPLLFEPSFAKALVVPNQKTLARFAAIVCQFYLAQTTMQPGDAAPLAAMRSSYDDLLERKPELMSLATNLEQQTLRNVLKASQCSPDRALTDRTVSDDLVEPVVNVCDFAWPIETFYKSVGIVSKEDSDEGLSRLQHHKTAIWYAGDSSRQFYAAASLYLQSVGPNPVTSYLEDPEDLDDDTHLINHTKIFLMLKHNHEEIILDLFNVDFADYLRGGKGHNHFTLLMSDIFHAQPCLRRKTVEAVSATKCHLNELVGAPAELEAWSLYVRRETCKAIEPSENLSSKDVRSLDYSAIEQEF